MHGGLCDDFDQTGGRLLPHTLGPHFRRRGWEPDKTMSSTSLLSAAAARETARAGGMAEQSRRSVWGCRHFDSAGGRLSPSSPPALAARMRRWTDLLSAAAAERLSEWKDGQVAGVTVRGAPWGPAQSNGDWPSSPRSQRAERTEKKPGGAGRRFRNDGWK